MTLHYVACAIVRHGLRSAWKLCDASLRTAGVEVGITRSLAIPSGAALEQQGSGGTREQHRSGERSERKGVKGSDTFPVGVSANAGEPPAGSSGHGSSDEEEAYPRPEGPTADTLRDLHPKLSQFINTGYLESVRQLRSQLMDRDWEEHHKLWAQQLGVAEFERYCAEHASEDGITMDVTFDAITRLYEHPDDLSALPKAEARMLARSMIQACVQRKQQEVFDKATEGASELAKFLEQGTEKGGSLLASAVKAVLPIPGLK